MRDAVGNGQCLVEFTQYRIENGGCRSSFWTCVCVCVRRGAGLSLETGNSETTQSENSQAHVEI